MPLRTTPTPSRPALRPLLPVVGALLALVALLAPRAVLAQGDAGPWLEKMLELYQKAPFSIDYTVELNIQQPQGQGLAIDGRGSVLYQDQTHMRSTMTMTTTLPGASSAMQMSLLSVADGESIWTEMDNPMMGGTQVVKVSLEEVENLAAQAGFGGLMRGGADPASSLRALKQSMTFELVEETGDLVVLEGTLTEALRQQLEQAPEGLRDSKLRMALERSSGLPRWMIMGPSADPMMRMTIDEVRFLDAGELPAGSFSYTPPEGVQVIEQPLQGQQP